METTAGIICDKCFEIVRVVPPENLQQVLNEAELQVEAAQKGSEIRPVEPKPGPIGTRTHLVD